MLCTVGAPVPNQPAHHPNAVLAFEGGETAALARLKYYLWDADLLRTYFDTVRCPMQYAMIVVLTQQMTWTCVVLVCGELAALRRDFSLLLWFHIMAAFSRDAGISTQQEVGHPPRLPHQLAQ
jgi:hypothetical protein